MSVLLGTFATIVLLVFYLYLLVHPQHVKRSCCFMLGVGGLLLALVGAFMGIFSPRATQVIGAILQIAGAIVALGSAVAACWEGEIPIVGQLGEDTNE